MWRDRIPETIFICTRQQRVGFRYRSILILLTILVVPFFHFALAQLPPAADQAFRAASDAMRQGDFASAVQGFSAVVKHVPTFAEAHLNLGLALEEQGKHDEAIRSFQKAIALKPRLRGANLFLGISYYRLNDFDQSLAAIKKETTASPKDANAWMWQGVVELAKNQPEQAAAALDKAAQLAPDNVDILYHRGQAHLLVSKNSYNEMFKADPKSWRVHQVMAQANAEAERPMDAIAEYQEAIKLAPTQPGLHEELGSEYRNAGKPQEAESAFLKELEIDPYNYLARYKLGVLAVERNEGAKAKELIEGALKLKSDLRHADYNLGRAEMQLGNDLVAAAHFEKATQSETDPEVLQQSWFQLGIVYRRLKRMPEAQQAMATFQKLKNQEAEASQKQLKNFQVRQDSEISQPTPAEQTPN
ncbi:MAG TPA: tetratricopeptide repeat protein [Terriglobales bacterium]|jgi:tetratricopeptide (TPR) repeat protein|nr:tetratricopeptide repeat protein [Terriglobales bacterium]